MIRAWHFVGDTLRDGRPVPADGAWLEHEGPLVLCVSGLHASLHPFDALAYAQGPILCLVDVDGDVLHRGDKLVARRRRIVARRDATETCRVFARACASDVLHLWDAPQIVRDYLGTGDESIRAAARAAARDAAWDAARAAERAAAWAAERDAAWDAARDAAWDAERAAAWDAERAAARAAARDAARDARRQRWAALVDALFAEAQL